MPANIVLRFTLLGMLACVGALGSCAPTGPAASVAPAAIASAHAASGSEIAGDEALPALNGEFAYVKARVLSKDAEADSLAVEVLAWERIDGFNAAGIAAGETGDVSCAQLVLFPAGIREGTVVVIACPAAEADAFPIEAHAIEKLDWFEERLARSLAAKA